MKRNEIKKALESVLGKGFKFKTIDSFNKLYEVSEYRELGYSKIDVYEVIRNLGLIDYVCVL